MKHVKDIEFFVKMLLSAEKMHSLIIQSPPGWAKSTTISKALKSLKQPHTYLGNYTTPLNLYNAMCNHPDNLLILDDCAGLFDNLISMSVLKAATWPQTQTGQRIVSWGSTSEKVAAPMVDFKGKLILLTNVIPEGRDAAAFRSRSLFYNIKFTKTNIASMLGEAARQKAYYPKPALAKQVAKFLVDRLDKHDYSQVNLRTLEQGYLAATVAPKEWKNYVDKLLPDVEPIELVRQLGATDDEVEDQCRHFIKVTSMSRSTFFRMREQLQLLARPGRKTKEELLLREKRRSSK